MRQVKGALFKHFIINIRANKSGIYDTLLNEEEKNIVKQQVLDALWYPYDHLKMIIVATTKAEAGADKNNLKSWGCEHAKKFLKNLHKDTVKERGKSLALKTYDRLFNLWFNFGKQHGEIVSDNEMNVIFEDFDQDFDLIYYLAYSWIQSFFEAYLGKKISTKFILKSWEGDEKTIINLTWNS